MSRTPITKLEGQWGTLVHMTSDLVVQSHRDKDLAAKYSLMLNHLKPDHMHSDKSMVLGMFRAPASKDRHHAFEGGLVAHMLEMWDIWKVLRDGLPVTAHTDYRGHYLSDSLVWRAILHHDLNKVFRYHRLVEDEDGNPLGEHSWRIDYAKPDDDRLGHMLTGTHKSLHILMRYGIALSPILHNALITAEGGFSESRPKSETAFAKLLSCLDELSANVWDRLRMDQFWDSKIGGLSGLTAEVSETR